MKEIIFDDNILQKENRIKIPNAVIDSLQLKEGDPVTIILDVQEECIKIRPKKSNKKK
jgi:antitoxin component of MazEF toxin-antitoxin module